MYSMYKDQLQFEPIWTNIYDMTQVNLKWIQV